MDEFRELVGNSFTGMVHPDDLKRVEFEINEQIKHSDRKMDFICYRIITKKGNIRWIEDCGHLEDTDSAEDTKLFYVFLSDITDSMPEERIRRIDRLNEMYNK
jgi:PAS domain S-box-containing protein